MGLFNFFKHQTVNSTVESNSQETEIGYNLDSEFKPAAKYYKFDTIEQIQRIPVPKTNFECDCDFTQSMFCNAKPQFTNKMAISTWR